MFDFKRCLFVAYLALAGVTFADDYHDQDENQDHKQTKEEFKRGEPFKKDQFPAGYLIPASIQTKDSMCPFGLDVNASYLYYHVMQEGMQLAFSGAAVELADSSFAGVLSNNQQIKNQNFKYNSGFKVGITGHIDNWDLILGYTWMNTNTTTSTGAAPSSSIGTPVWVANNWFQATSATGEPLAADNLTSRWHVNVNLVDVLASRPCYESSHLILKPFGGLKGGFIYQHLNINFYENGDLTTRLPAQPVESLNRSKYWGVGPEFGLDSCLLLPMKFRLEGNIAWSLLYSQFNVYHKETAATADQKPSTLQYSLKKLPYLREILEMSLGFGWGTYLGCDSYHIDFSASYDFVKIDGQNMMRRTIDNFITQVSSNAGDLYLHGLNVRASFDF